MLINHINVCLEYAANYASPFVQLQKHHVTESQDRYSFRRGVNGLVWGKFAGILLEAHGRDVLQSSVLTDMAAFITAMSSFHLFLRVLIFSCRQTTVQEAPGVGTNLTLCRLISCVQCLRWNLCPILIAAFVTNNVRITVCIFVFMIGMSLSVWS